MPPSTDCSPATSCGGCRSYSGAVADGRLNSSATATKEPSIHPRAHPSQARAGWPGPVGEAPGLVALDSNVCSGHSYRPAPTVAEADGGNEDVRKSGRTSPTPVGTSFCTTCGQVGGWTHVDMWRGEGTRPRRPSASPAPPARSPPTACGHEKPGKTPRVVPPACRCRRPTRPSSPTVHSPAPG